MNTSLAAAVTSPAMALPADRSLASVVGAVQRLQVRQRRPAQAGPQLVRQLRQVALQVRHRVFVAFAARVAPRDRAFRSLVRSLS